MGARLWVIQCSGTPRVCARKHPDLDLGTVDGRAVVVLPGLLQHEVQVRLYPSVEALGAIGENPDGPGEVEHLTAYHQGIAGHRAGRDVDAVAAGLHLEPAGGQGALED